MSTPKASPEQIARLRTESQQLRPALAAEMPAVREEWKQFRDVTEVVVRHSKELDEYINAHGPMTRAEVVERALTQFLSQN